MDIGVEWRPLGRVDVAALRDALLSQPESLWIVDFDVKERKAPGRPTQHVYLTTSKGWPDFQPQRLSGWEPLHAVAAPVIEGMLERHPDGGTIANAFFTRLAPGGSIAQHRDTGALFQHAHRIHVPIVTNPEVEFRVGRSTIDAIEGEAFEVNNWRPHSVTNGGDQARIHFIVDYVPATS